MYYDDYLMDWDDDGYYEPQPVISWHFQDTEGCEDYATPDEVANVCQCYTNAGATFTATLEYTEPEED